MRISVPLSGFVHSFNRCIKHGKLKFVHFKNMAGIYIHIPFCKQKCHYCNFFSLASLKNRVAFLDALHQEIALQREYLGNQTVNTIYFGGGTPSMLKPEEISLIIQLLKEKYSVDPEVEITLEANPDDLSENWLQGLAQTGVNRLSMGIQSFFDDDLTYLNRVHSARQAKEAIQSARKSGFDNITIDLIYGIPTLNEEKWKQNIEEFLRLDIPHLSAYSLTVEARTALSHHIAKGKLPAVDEQQAIRHFEILMQEMDNHGFVHYEISNFAKPGFYSKHNSIYWLGGHYLGLGPSAHSFNGVSRQWNVSNLQQYTDLRFTAKTEFEKEILTTEQRYNEYVMTSLRTVWGCDPAHIRNVFGNSFVEYCMNEAKKHIDSGRLELRDHRLFLSSTGKLFADGIASDLFMS